MGKTGETEKGAKTVETEERVAAAKGRGGCQLDVPSGIGGTLHFTDGEGVCFFGAAGTAFCTSS